MNRTKIDWPWLDYTWNPVVGCLGPDNDGKRCFYCYAKRMASRLRGRYGYPEDDPFKPVLHVDRLGEPLKVKKPSTIFVCSMGELFRGSWADVTAVFETVKKAYWHTFIFLTKQPQHLPRYWPGNVVVGVTVEDRNRMGRITELRRRVPYRKKFVSIEPMMDHFQGKDFCGMAFIVVGYFAGAKMCKLTKGMIESIEHPKVWYKENLLRWFPELRGRNEEFLRNRLW